MPISRPPKSRAVTCDYDKAINPRIRSGEGLTFHLNHCGMILHVFGWSHMAVPFLCFKPQTIMYTSKFQGLARVARAHSAIEEGANLPVVQKILSDNYEEPPEKIKLR